MPSKLSYLAMLFEKMPVPCQVRFLSGCTEAVAVLMVARSPLALQEALVGDTNWMEISKFTELVERFIYNPKPGDIAQLAAGRDRMDSLESQAEFHGRCATPATIASLLGNCAIEPTAERLRDCFTLIYKAMIANCESTDIAIALVDSTLEYHLEDLTQRLATHNDSERPPFTFMRPFWVLSRPPGWPVSGVWLTANALASFAGKLGLSAFKKHFLK